MKNGKLLLLIAIILHKDVLMFELFRVCRGDQAWCVALITTLMTLPMAYALPPQGVVEASENTVVIIEAYSNANKLAAYGSGIVTAKETVTTNCHVLNGGVQYLVRFKGRSEPGYVSSVDTAHDLCSLHVNSLQGSPAKFGSSLQVVEGDRVFAIAAPKIPEISIHEGIIEGLRQMRQGKFIRTSAFASPGSSGGGLFDKSGNLLGIIGYGPDKAGASGDVSKSFVLPVELVQSLSLKKKGASDEPPFRVNENERELKRLRSESNWQEILILCSNWLKNSPEYPGYWFATEGRAQALMKLGRLQDALDGFKEAVQIEPLSASAWNSIGIIYADIGNNAAAANAFLQATEAEPNSIETADSYFNLAQIYGKAGKIDAERKVYEKVIQITPNDSRAQLGLGISLVKLGDVRAGLKHVVKATQLAPADANALAALAMTYDLLGDKPQREIAMAKLQVLSPTMKSNLDKIFAK